MEKEKQGFEWKPEHGLSHVPDDVLAFAEKLAAEGYVDEPTLEEDGTVKARDSLGRSLCDGKADWRAKGTGAVAKSSKSTGLRWATTLPLTTCSRPTCGEEWCPAKVAAYLKYLENRGEKYDAIGERTVSRALEPGPYLYRYDWEPKDASSFALLTKTDMELLKAIARKKLVLPYPYPDRNLVKMYAHLPDKCRESAGTIQDIAKFVAGATDSDHGKCSTLRRFPTSPLLSDGAAKRSCAKCEATFCPFTAAAYMIYLEKKELPFPPRAAGAETRPVNGAGFGFELDERWRESAKREVAAAPDDLYAAASAAQSERLVSLGSERDSKNGDFRLSLSAKWAELEKTGKTLSDVLAGLRRGWGEEASVVTAGALDVVPGSDAANKVAKLAATIDYMRRKGVDVEAVRGSFEKRVAERTKKAEGWADMARAARMPEIRSIACVFEGSKGSGKKAAAEALADELSRAGKTKSWRHEYLTFDQAAKGLVEETKNGPIYKDFAPGAFYVLGGLDDFLSAWEETKDAPATNQAAVAYRHLVKKLGENAKDKYVAVSSLGPSQTKRFLAVDDRIRFSFGALVAKFPDMTADETFAAYEAALSPEVASMISDREATKREFLDFLAFNERSLPFRNAELAKFLADDSNMKGSPTPPHGGNDPRSAAKEMGAIVGMESVKEKMARFEADAKFRRRAKAAGLKLEAAPTHMVFTGNPGTGKTTVARIVARFLNEIGALEKGQLVEVERKDLVAKYSGQTASKTAAAIESAVGGVLFVDEAYSLAGGDSDGYGREALATLVKAMEDRKDELVVILAGYEKEMAAFVDENPGLASRIGYSFHFEDYSPEALAEMFRRSLSKSGFEHDDAVVAKAKATLEAASRRKNFGNGRFVKKLVAETVARHASKDGAPGWKLERLEADDVPTAAETSGSRDGVAEGTTIEGLVGLEQVKEQMRAFRARARFEREAAKAGAKARPSNRHVLFLGPPGTGKTTVARAFAREAYEIGIVSEPKLVECSRADLVAEYLGQTAPKTQAVIDRAVGGVLFVDEAYSLVASSNGAQDPYGREALATLVKAMEDLRDDLVVALAGYEKEMSEFLAANPGLASRIGYAFRFRDYSPEEVAEIWERKLGESGLRATPEAKEAATRVARYFARVPNFGNGRFAERLASATYEKRAARAAEEGFAGDLTLVEAKDIPTEKETAAATPGGGSMPSSAKGEDLARVATHEAGHAIVAAVAAPDEKVTLITVEAEGSGSLGRVERKASGRSLSTKSELETRIMVSLGGLAAEKVVYGEWSDGGTSDLEKARAIAKAMASKFGMFGLGLSEKEADEAAKRALEEKMEETVALLEGKKAALEEAAAKLAADGSLSAEELDATLARRAGTQA